MSQSLEGEDLESFRVVVPASVQRRVDGRQHRYQRAFLKGPVPMTWLRRAIGLPGHALAVAVVLRFYQGLHDSMPVIKVTYAKILAECPTSTLRTVQRGVQTLERAGLIVVQRPPGRMMEIELVEATEVDQPPADRA